MLNMNSQEFDTQLAQAKKASLKSPVIVTEDGTPKHVLLSFDEFHKITSLLHLRYDTEVPKKSLTTAELLSMDVPDGVEIDDDAFDNILQKANIQLKPAEFD